MIERRALIMTSVLSAAAVHTAGAADRQRSYTRQESRNVETIKRHIFEFWRDGKFEIAPEIFDPGFVDHNPAPGEPGNLEGYTRGARIMQRGFSDHRYEVVHLFPIGDTVVDHWILRAVNTGEFDGKPATGREVEFRGTDIFRMKDGKIAEIWHVEELLQLYGALGRVS